VNWWKRPLAWMQSLGKPFKPPEVGKAPAQVIGVDTANGQDQTAMEVFVYRPYERFFQGDQGTVIFENLDPDRFSFLREMLERNAARSPERRESTRERIRREMGERPLTLESLMGRPPPRMGPNRAEERRRERRRQQHDDLNSAVAESLMYMTAAQAESKPAPPVKPSVPKPLPHRRIKMRKPTGE